MLSRSFAIVEKRPKGFDQPDDRRVQFGGVDKHLEPAGRLQELWEIRPVMRLPRGGRELYQAWKEVLEGGTVVPEDTEEFVRVVATELSDRTRQDSRRDFRV